MGWRRTAAHGEGTIHQAKRSAVVEQTFMVLADGADEAVQRVAEGKEAPQRHDFEYMPEGEVYLVAQLGRGNAIVPGQTWEYSQQDGEPLFPGRPDTDAGPGAAAGSVGV